MESSPAKGATPEIFPQKLWPSEKINISMRWPFCETLCDVSQKLSSQTWFLISINKQSRKMVAGSSLQLVATPKYFTKNFIGLRKVKFLIFWAFFESLWIFSKNSSPNVRFWVQFKKRWRKVPLYKLLSSSFQRKVMVFREVNPAESDMRSSVWTRLISSV